MARDDTILCEFTVCRLSPVIAGSAIVFATVKTGTTISFHADCLRSGNTRFSLYRIIEFFVPFLLPPPSIVSPVFCIISHTISYTVGKRAISLIKKRFSFPL